MTYADLADIWPCIADDSAQRADLFLDMLEGKLALLATQPALGRERPELVPRLRAFPVKRHRVFYRPMRNGIEVLRVLHSARHVTQAKFGVTLG